MNVDSNQRSSDPGAILPLVLVITVVLAVVGLAIATYTATALGSSEVTDKRVDRLAAAEGGMQDALLALSSTGTCPTAADLQARNGAVLSVTGCESKSVQLGDDVPYSLVLTALGLDPGTLAFARLGAEPNEVEIGGQVYLSQTVTGSADPDKLTAPGLVVVQAAECPGTPLPSPDWLGAANVDCTEDAWTSYTDVPSIDASTPPSSVTEPSGCQLILAGTHGNLEVKGDAYFASGVHRVQGEIKIGTNSKTANAVAGYSDGAVTLPASHNCYQAQVDDVASGGAEGAVFVLEGSGSITLNHEGTTMEFFGLDTGDRRLSLVAYPPSAPDPNGVFAVSARDPNISGNPAANRQPVLRTVHPNAKFWFYGEVWTPRGFFDIDTMSSSGAAGAAFQGGAVLSRFSAKTSSDVTGLIFAGDEVPIRSYFKVQVTAAADGASTTVSVVAHRSVEGDVTVQSWRVL